MITTEKATKSTFFGTPVNRSDTQVLYAGGLVLLSSVSLSGWRWLQGCRLVDYNNCFLSGQKISTQQVEDNPTNGPDKSTGKILVDKSITVDTVDKSKPKVS